MRKGSKKVTEIRAPEPPIDYESPEDKPNYEKLVIKVGSVQDILLRLCDACHEMDTRTEPWASIRKDIERLK
jgi:hypothetical protein